MNLRPQPPLHETNTVALQRYIGELHRELAEAYIRLTGLPAAKHTTDCAVNQAPAYRPGPCDCGAVGRLSELTISRRSQRAPSTTSRTPGRPLHGLKV